MHTDTQYTLYNVHGRYLIKLHYNQRNFYAFDLLLSRRSAVMIIQQSLALKRVSIRV